MIKIIQSINCSWGDKYIHCLLFLFFLVSFPSHAALVSLDSVRWGAGSLTKDSATSLQWLDLNIATGISYNTMLKEQDGGLYTGFRYATVSEIEILFINAGTTDVNSSSAANLTAAQVLNSFIGASSSFRGKDEVFGITGTLTSTGSLSAIIDHSFNNGASFYDISTLTGPVYGLDYSNSSIGNWLVKTTEVPVPPAFILFTSALACLSMLKRK